MVSQEIKKNKVLPVDESPPNLWVAEDPTQHGTAFAWASTRRDQSETLAEWRNDYGVEGRMVNR